MSVPQLMNSSIFPSDVVQRAKELISQMKGNTIGSMTGENGLEIVRIKVAEFISKRDEIPVSFEDIYLTNGVSGGLEVLNFFRIIKKLYTYVIFIIHSWLSNWFNAKMLMLGF